MSRIFILAFVLFATLFAVNAVPLELVKRETKFLPCPGLPPDVSPLDVNMTPDPVVPGGQETFVIKGTMQQDIDEGAFLGIAFIDLNAKQPIGTPLVVDFCSQPGITCPVKAGTEFTTTQQYTAPTDLPQTYAIGIGLGEGQPPNVTPIGCAYAIIGGSGAAPSADLDLWNLL